MQTHVAMPNPVKRGGGIAQRVRRAGIHTMPAPDAQAVSTGNLLLGRGLHIDRHGADCRAPTALNTFGEVCINALPAQLGKAGEHRAQRTIISIAPPQERHPEDHGH